MIEYKPQQLRLLFRIQPHQYGATPVLATAHSGPAVGKACNYGGGGCGVICGQTTVDGRKQALALVPLSGDQERHFGGEQCLDRVGGSPFTVIRITMIGLAGFGGFLARPFQETRYRSLSQSLPRSRSRQ